MAQDAAASAAAERRQLLAELELERKQLVRNIEHCRIKDIENPTFIDRWSLKDIVGHVASWEAECITALRELAEGRRPELLDFPDSRIDEWNQDHAARKRDLDFGSIMGQLKGGRERLLELIDGLTDDELFAEGSVHAFVIHEVISHDRQHWHEIAAKLAGAPGVRREA